MAETAAHLVDHVILHEATALNHERLEGLQHTIRKRVLRHFRRHGLLEVGRAFAALPEPPLRSVVFAAVSAEEMGLLGSAYLAEHGPAPAGSTSANLNMDMLRRNGPDSLYVFGQTYSGLGSVFREVLEDHPELGFRVRSGLQMPDLDLIRFSDQFSYLARGVPFLFFNSGFHSDLHTRTTRLKRLTRTSCPGRRASCCSWPTPWPTILRTRSGRRRGESLWKPCRGP